MYHNIKILHRNVIIIRTNKAGEYHSLSLYYRGRGKPGLMKYSDNIITISQGEEEILTQLNILITYDLSLYQRGKKKFLLNEIF